MWILWRAHSFDRWGTEAFLRLPSSWMKGQSSGPGAFWPLGSETLLHTALCMELGWTVSETDMVHIHGHAVPQQCWQCRQVSGYLPVGPKPGLRICLNTTLQPGALWNIFTPYPYPSWFSCPFFPLFPSSSMASIRRRQSLILSAPFLLPIRVGIKLNLALSSSQKHCVFFPQFSLQATPRPSLCPCPLALCCTFL